MPPLLGLGVWSERTPPGTPGENLAWAGRKERQGDAAWPQKDGAAGGRAAELVASAPAVSHGCGVCRDSFNDSRAWPGYCGPQGATFSSRPQNVRTIREGREAFLGRLQLGTWPESSMTLWRENCSRSGRWWGVGFTVLPRHRQRLPGVARLFYPSCSHPHRGTRTLTHGTREGAQSAPSGHGRDVLPRVAPVCTLSSITSSNVSNPCCHHSLPPTVSRGRLRSSPFTFCRGPGRGGVGGEGARAGAAAGRQVA